jgi:hypothetical protein
MTNDLLIYGENICAFPQILGTPSSLHPIPSEFPYIYMRKILFSFFISAGTNIPRYPLATCLNLSDDYVCQNVCIMYCTV